MSTADTDRTERKHQVKVLLSDDEKKMLDALTKADGIAAADVVRTLIRKRHGERFHTEKGGAQKPTVRGIIEDVMGPAHYFAGHIASRTTLPLSKVLATLRELDEKRIMQRVSGGESDSTWASRMIGLEDTIHAAERAGFALDKKL